MSAPAYKPDQAETSGPRVFVVSRPSLDPGYQTFLSDHRTSWTQDPDATDAERIIEFAGRVCYMSFGERQSPKSNCEYIAHLIEHGHESVLEHVNWSFVLTGISRAFTHQLVRHRVGFAFSQLSQQYHDESEAQFVPPEGLADYPEAQQAWEEAMSKAAEAYRFILGHLDIGKGQGPRGGLSREHLRAIRSAARSVLPNATRTAIFVTANARALRHFLTVRGSIEGDAEMRYVSAALFNVIEPDAPSVFCDFRLEQLPDESPILRRVGLPDGRP